MKEKLLTSLFIGLFAMSAHDVRAQSNTPPAKVEIPNTQLLKLTSAVVNQEYQLFIHLPNSYLKDTGKAYPVVYLLDAQFDFPFFTGVYGGQYYDGFLPEFIIVGITWGGKDPDAGSRASSGVWPMTALITKATLPAGVFHATGHGSERKNIGSESVA